MESLRRQKIIYLKGVGPQRAKLLEKELGIKTWRDLMYHLPSSYVDRSQFYTIRSFTPPEMPSVQVKGRFIGLNVKGEGAKRRLTGLFTDLQGGTMEVTWFNSVTVMQKTIQTGVDYVLFGKPTIFNDRWQMVHPEVDPADKALQMVGLRGIYPLTQSLRQRNISSRMFQQWTTAVLQQVRFIADTLPASIVQRLKLMPLHDALHEVHWPTSTARLARARERLKFEELFYLQLNIQRHARQRKATVPGMVFTRVGEAFHRFYDEVLPFPLTEAQKRVVREIHADMRSGCQMNRLLQGDVGSGKTLVALMAMLIAMGNGHQSALMAPTEILAQQHFESLRSMVAPLGVNVRLLTGSTKKADREVIHRELLDGSLHMIVGTHALIEDAVQFKSLGLAVIDEQHRFGVMQRARLWNKQAVAPHVLVMTATPIPRTLAMTVYGDLDVSVIDELPPGRKPIVTQLRYEEERLRVWQGVSRQLAQGRQIYIVYPLIDHNDKTELRSLEEGYDTVCETFRQCQVSIVHGRMKPEQKDAQMQLFASGKAQILVATTVIEVGVNVPNASTMIIENAERFGLSQLHQLRGRVGRGADQSFCILMSKRKLAKDTRRRLELMTQTTDGFIIAEADMQMRGPGDIEGTMQSGLPFDLKIANLATDGQIVQMARDAALAQLDADPAFTSPDGRLLALQLAHLLPSTADLSRVS